MVRYRIVPQRSEVVIDATSNVHPIHTRTNGLEGFIELGFLDGAVEVTAGAAADLVLAVDRLSSGNPLETRELRRRIDARRHPTITGRLHTLAPAGEPDVYLARGDVTFRGVTRTAEDRIRMTRIGDAGLRIEGEHDFDVRDFGMDPPRILVLRVDPVVRVRVSIVAER